MDYSAPFPAPLYTRDLVAPGKEHYFELTEDFFYNCAFLGCLIVVPKGFDTDFASIPPLLRPIFNPVGPVKRPAVIHDFGYYYRHLIVQNADGSRHNIPVSRLIMDQVFRAAMKDVPAIGAFHRWAMYTGVRAGGGGPWSDNAKLLAKEMAQEAAA